MTPNEIYEVIHTSLEDILKALPELKPYTEKTAFLYNVTPFTARCGKCANEVYPQDNYCRICGAKFLRKRFNT